MVVSVADNEYHPSLARKLLDLCQLQPGQHVLDLACGTGLLALSAAEAVAPRGRVVGVDITPAMLEQAQTKAQAQVLSSVVSFVLGDMEQLQDALSAGLQVNETKSVCSMPNSQLRLDTPLGLLQEAEK